MKKKASFTLMEVLVTLLLSSIVLAFFLHLLFTSEKNRKLASYALAQAHQHLLVDLSLTRTLSQLCHATEARHDHATSKRFCLSSDYPGALGPALFLVSNQGLDCNTPFMGCQQVICFVDQQNRLCLRTESATQQQRMDVLLEGVASAEWRFFDAQKNEWVDNWPEKKGFLPALAKLRLAIKNDSKTVLEYGFIINTDKVIETPC